MSFKRFNYILFSLLILAGLANASMPSGLTIEKKFVPGFGLSIGKVFIIDGTAIVVHENQNVGYKVFKGMLLFQKDTLYTQKPGRVLLNMQDGSQLTIGSQSQLTLNKISLMPQRKMRKSFISMKRGKARFNVRKLSKFKQTDFKVKTQTALIGVRGSDFFVAANKNSTSVTTFDKTKLEVIGLAKPQLPPTILKDFQRVHVDAGDQPSDIEHVSPDEIQRIKSDYKYASQPVNKEQIEKKEKQDQSEKTEEKSDSETDSESQPDEDTDTDTSAESSTDSQTADKSSENTSSDESQPAMDEAEQQESPIAEDPQTTVIIPTQEIVVPATIEQATPPDPDQMPSNVFDKNTNKEESNTVDQTQEIFEQIHEQEVKLPSFPETP
jgi:hypothetical protein